MSGFSNFGYLNQVWRRHDILIFFSTFCRARQCPGRDFDPIYFKFKHNVVLDYPCLLLKISNIGHVSNFRFCQEPCPGGPLSARFGAKMAAKKKTNKKTSNLGRWGVVFDEYAPAEYEFDSILPI